MKVIKNIGDIKNLVIGDEYTIDYGIDYNKPEDVNLKKIETIQSAIDKKFNTEKIKESDKKQLK
jgi:hypothetical protein